MLSQVEVALAVLSSFYFEIVVEEPKQMALESIDLQCCVGLQNFRERMVLQTLVVPNLRSFNQSDEKQIFPIGRANFVFFADVEYPLNIDVRDDWGFFLHFPSHHH